MFCMKQDVTIESKVMRQKVAILNAISFYRLLRSLEQIISNHHEQNHPAHTQNEHNDRTCPLSPNHPLVA